MNIASVREAPTAVTKIGEAAPVLQLPDLAGRTVDLAAFRGTPMLVLFWNPGCGFCQQMLSDLKAWEAHRSEQGAQLLIVSTGTVEANRTMGLKSPIVLEPEFRIGYAFGASGTPSAIMIDSYGRLASSVAVGASAVLALAKNGSLPTKLAQIDPVDGNHQPEVHG
jgi:peroxiredoxin